MRPPYAGHVWKAGDKAVHFDMGCNTPDPEDCVLVESTNVPGSNGMAVKAWRAKFGDGVYTVSERFLWLPDTPKQDKTMPDQVFFVYPEGHELNRQKFTDEGDARKAAEGIARKLKTRVHVLKPVASAFLTEPPIGWEEHGK